MITREDFIRETVIGTRVVHKVSGYTGEVRLVIPEWGVEVWVPDRLNERERWSWGMITRRYPRLVKRYPRPFRYPRLLPSLQCHCKIGKMEVKGENTVQCLRCSFLVGSEAFPRRFERATKLLHRFFKEQPTEKRGEEKRPTHKGAGGPRLRKTHPRIQGGKKKKTPPKGKRNLVIRSKRRKEAIHGKAKRKVQRKGNPKVSPRNPVSKAPRHDQRKAGKGKTGKRKARGIARV